MVLTRLGDDVVANNLATIPTLLLPRSEPPPKGEEQSSPFHVLDDLKVLRIA